MLSHLAGFAVALALPILVLVGLLLWQFATSERARLERGAADLARSVTTAIDRDLTGLLATLDVLSLSPYLQTGEFETFHKKLVEVRRRQGIYALVRDPSGQQLVNSRRPWGEPLPLEPLPDVDPIVSRTKRPFVSDLLYGSVAATWVYNIATPVLRGEELVYFLNLSLPLDRLRQVVLDEHPPAEWRVVVLDRNGAILARTHRHEELVGKRGPETIVAQTTARVGTWEGSDAEGAPIFGAYATSGLSDWRVAVQVRQSDLNGPVRRSLLLFAALGLGVLALSTLLAILFGRRVTGAMHALADNAAALGRGETPAPLHSSLSEVNQVGRELATAAVVRREREADLREANDEIQRYAYIVSHDLRAPLVNIMGFTTEIESLRESLSARLAELQRLAPPDAGSGQDQDLVEDLDEAIRFIKASIEKMDRLIGAILKVSRDGQRRFDPESVDVEGLIRGIAGSLATQAERAGATIAVAPLPRVTSDRLALEQIFTNLIDNALKYLRPGVPGVIEVKGRTAGGSVFYDVQDNGRGIDERDRERVFELFRRAGSQEQPGEGIGLAFVRNLARRIGGSITLTSEPGRGSTFTVRLPAALAAEPEKRAA